MESQAHRGQVVIELLIVTSLLLAFFWFAGSLAAKANNLQAQMRFPSKTHFRK